MTYTLLAHQKELVDKLGRSDIPARLLLGGHMNWYRRVADSYLERLDGQPTSPRPPSKKHPIIATVVIIVTLWVAWHPYHAETTKNNPPIECILAGGTWDIWHGWQCH